MTRPSASPKTIATTVRAIVISAPWMKVGDVRASKKTDASKFTAQPRMSRRGPAVRAAPHRSSAGRLLDRVQDDRIDLVLLAQLAQRACVLQRLQRSSQRGLEVCLVLLEIDAVGIGLWERIADFVLVRVLQHEVRDGAIGLPHGIHASDHDLLELVRHLGIALDVDGPLVGIVHFLFCAALWISTCPPVWIEM